VRAHLLATLLPTLLKSPVSTPVSPLLALMTNPPVSLSALAALISDFRIFARLPGLLGIYTWARSIALSPPDDPVLKHVAYAQVVVNTFYQVCENIAYLGDKGVITRGFGLGDGVGPKGKAELARRTGRMYIWSSRFWAGHVALEAVRLAREAYLLREERALADLKREAKLEGEGMGVEESGVLVDDVNGRVMAEKWRGEDEVWWRSAFTNAAWAPLTLHWSRDEGLVSQEGVAGLGMVAGWLSLREDWRRTAV
jgi:hypothetical protein